MTTPPSIEDSEGRRNRVNDWRLGRLGLIGGVLVAVIGVGSSLVTSYYSGQSSASQAQADFQRTQRITAYTAFVAEVSKFALDATRGIHVLMNSNYAPTNTLPRDKNGQVQMTPPSLYAVNSLVDEIDAQLVAVGTKESVIELIATKPVREMAEAITSGLDDIDTNFQYI
jgi:hypothetical protein